MHIYKYIYIEGCFPLPQDGRANGIGLGTRFFFDSTRTPNQLFYLFLHINKLYFLYFQSNKIENQEAICLSCMCSTQDVVKRRWGRAWEERLVAFTLRTS